VRHGSTDEKQYEQKTINSGVQRHKTTLPPGHELSVYKDVTNM